MGTVNTDSIITSVLLRSASEEGRWRRVRELYVLERGDGCYVWEVIFFVFFVLLVCLCVERVGDGCWV